MPRFAANLTMLFTEVPMLDRPGLAAQAGFDGVEVLFPYDHAVSDWQTALAGLPLALVNTPPGDWVSGVPKPGVPNMSVLIGDVLAPICAAWARI